MKLTITTLFLLLNTISFAQIPSYVSSNGLVGWWPFNGNANDESGYGNNGTVNGATLVDGESGVSNAYYFNNAANSISFSSPFLNGTQQSSFTFHAKVKLNSLNLTQAIWVKTLFWGEVVFAISNTNEIRFWWANSITGNKYSIIYSQANVLELNKWHDITVCFENSVGQIYLDEQPIQTNLQWIAQGGNLLSTTQIDGSCNFAQDPNSSKIGNEPNGAYLNGTIDEFAIWNRVLSPMEIVTLHQLCLLEIASQPQDQSVATSVGTASFSTSVSSTSATYQWQTNLGLGFQSLSNAGQYSGVTSATLTVSGLSLSNNNQVFRCIINDSGCVDTTAEAVLTIIDDASIQSHTNTSLQLYPNPVKDVMTLVGLKGEAVSFAVYSVDGKLIKSGQTSGEIQLEDLKKGNYILKIDNEALPFVKL
jgi:hypothetical protein